MKNTQKHIDDFFREKLGSYSEAPPADAWQELDSKLDTLAPQAVPTSPLRWLGHVGMVSLIAVLGFSLLPQFFGGSDNNKETKAANEQTVGKSEISSVPVAGQAANTGTPVVTGTETTGITGNDNGTNNNGNNTNNQTIVPAAQNDEASAQNGGSGSMKNAAAKEAGSGSANNNAGKEKATGNSKKQQNSRVAPGKKEKGNATNNDRRVAARQDNYNSSLDAELLQQPIGDKQSSIQNQLNSTSPATTVAAAKPVAALTTEKVNLPIENKKEAPVVKKPRPVFDRWEAGVKGGYERGFGGNAATKYAIAPYLQFNLSPKMAIMVQPAAKYANAPERTIGAVQSYYKVNNDGKVVDNGSYTTIKVDGSEVYTEFNGKFRYTQSHDSIVKSNRTGGTYMEYELPILAKYKLSAKASVYGGVNVVYSKLQGVTEHTFTKAGIVRTVDTLMSGRTMPVAPAIEDVITYSGTTFSEYNGPLYPATRENRVRLGAMVIR